MRKTIVLLTGAITLTLLLAVPVVFAHGGMDSMMGHGGMGMMSNPSMDRMMDAMNTPEGKEMIKACSNFMERLNQ